MSDTTNEETALILSEDPDVRGWAMAVKLAKSALVPRDLHGRPEDVFLIGMMGRDLGISLTQALLGISVIRGRPAIGATLMRACVLRSGLAKYVRIKSRSATAVTAETWRKGSPEPDSITFTLKEADAAGYTAVRAGKGPGAWQKTPVTMMGHRAMSMLIREVYPDVVLGMYTPDELEDIPVRETRVTARVVESSGVAEHGSVRDEDDWEDELEQLRR